MPTINQANGLLAEFAIFPVDLDSQASLVEQAIQNIESTLKHKAGFASGSVLRSRDGLRVTSYVQWSDRTFYKATQPFTDFPIPDVHLFEIFAAKPQGGELHLSSNNDESGIFASALPHSSVRLDRANYLSCSCDFVCIQALGGAQAIAPDKSQSLARHWRCTGSDRGVISIQPECRLASLSPAPGLAH
ncbi:hypothetical protein [Pseudanabaena sp. PCC 6802]|uniref:hypothetical protein n=1 Tax=Pseudanabaena sp. PCC 6802 TaxID=118173 RepID=UPI00034798AB|nr:hypothetical protein [Pseudanabaena sp. PCC 6802]